MAVSLLLTPATEILTKKSTRQSLVEAVLLVRLIFLFFGSSPSLFFVSHVAYVGRVILAVLLLLSIIFKNIIISSNLYCGHPWSPTD